MSFSHPLTKRVDHYARRTTGYSEVQDLLQWNRRVKVEGGGKQKHGSAALVPGAYQPPPRTRKSADNGGRPSLVRPLLVDKPKLVRVPAPPAPTSALPSAPPSAPPTQR